MAPPVVTPSPHRFVSRRNQHKTPSQAESRTAPSPAQPRRPQVQQDAVKPSQKFKPTPRFGALRPIGSSSFQSTPRAIQGDGFSTLATSNHVDAVQSSRGPRHKLTKVESIHDASQEDSDTGHSHDEVDEMLFDFVADEETVLVESAEGEGVSHAYHRAPTGPHEKQSQQLSDDNHEPPVPPSDPPAKRRRLVPNPDLTPRQETTAKQVDPNKTDNDVETLKSLPRGGKSPRFSLPGQFPASTASMAPMESPTQSVGARPRNPFLLPLKKHGITGSGLNASEVITPLPEHFSPHRRSQKFIPGGMADVVRSWILSVGHGGSQANAASHQPSQRTERTSRAGQPTRIQVTERAEDTSSHHLKLVAGQATKPARLFATQNEGGSSSIRSVLVGPAKGSLREVKPGNDVVIAPPTWEVEVGPHGEKWLVAVDWNVASEGTAPR